MAEEGYKRRLSAILSADAVGYSRLMRDDEEATVRTLTAYRTALTHMIQQYRGRVVDSPGDNILAEFSSVVDAVNCGVEIQRELAERNAELPEDRRMQFRVGINMGDVLEEGDRIYGDGVNIAARMESLSETGEICISGTVYDAIENKIGLEYECLGEHEVKNIDKPIRAYRVLSYPGAAAHRVVKAKKAVGKMWRNVIAGIAAILIAGSAFAVWHLHFRAPRIEPAALNKMAYPLPDKPSIAVLPFVNMSDDPQQEFFCDGITEEIITGLAKMPDLFVIARNSSFTYKGKAIQIHQVAQDLGVRYVLEGSVRKSQDNLRITAQLIDVLKGIHLWAERWDRALKNVFEIQDDITMKIATAMQVELTEGERARVMAKGTNNLDAYLKALGANEKVIRFNRADNESARRLAEEAIGIDPQYAFAYSILGKTHLFDVWLGTSSSPKESITQAMKLVHKAIELDESLGVAYGLLGFLYTMTGQHEKGIAEAEKAISLEPNSDLAHQALGLALRFGGRPMEAVPVIQKAIRLNPFAPSTYRFNLGLSYLFSGQPEKAIIECKKAVEREPDNLGAQIALTVAYGFSGRDKQARAAAQEVLRINPKFNLEAFSKSLVYKNQTDKERYIVALGKAGLPEHLPLPIPDKPSIAVLPFVNMSGDREQEYFSDGITEEIITALSKTPRLFVIARTSSFKYKGKSVDVRTVGRELGVRYVLEGSIRISNNQIRITAQLIDAPTEKHLWAERYDRPLGEIFAVQDGITLAIVRAMQVRLTEGEQARLIGKGTKNLDAYLRAIKAQEQYFLMSREGSEQAKEFAKKAITQDPKYAFPYTILANSHMLDVWFKFSKFPKESMRLAANAAQKALALNDSDPSIYSTLTNLYVMQRKYEKAITSAERGLEINPGGARAQIGMGIALLFSCRFNEAIPFFERAVRLNPYPRGTYYRLLATAYRLSGRYEQAISEYKKAIQTEPNDLFTHLGLTVAYIKLGRIQEADLQVEKILRIHPKFSVNHFARTLTFSDQSVVDDMVGSLREAGLK